MSTTDEDSSQSRVALRGVDTTMGEPGLCASCDVWCDEGPDACLGYIPGVSHACCGHGDPGRAYAVLGGFADQDCETVSAFVPLEGEAASAFFKLVADAGISHGTRPDDAQELTTLLRAVAEHRTAIRNAGTVRVDERDQQIAQAKHRADERLWSVLP